MKNEVKTEVQPSVFQQWFNRTRHGEGSFVLALFDAFLKGGQDNRIRIEQAFPNYFNEGDHKLNF